MIERIINPADNSIQDDCTLRKPIEPNCEIRVGDNPCDQGVVFNLYLENPPNRFQRWMMKVCLGLYWRALKTNEDD